MVHLNFKWLIIFAAIAGVAYVQFFYVLELDNVTKEKTSNEFERELEENPTAAGNPEDEQSGMIPTLRNALSDRKKLLSGE
jgi:hypothetical protein